jgi:hypothetical protein
LLNQYDDDSTVAGCFAVGFIILVALCSFFYHWYESSVQVAVWQREGIQITTWEAFFGAKPAERQINIKPEAW